MNGNFFIKKLSCPVCEISFQTTKLKENKKVNIIKKDTDMCTYFSGENPYFYEINVCPFCGFSFSDKFKQKLNSAQINNFTEVFSQQWKQHDYGGQRDANQAIQTYKIALLSGKTIGLKASALASICLRICWLYRLLENREEEKRFMKFAVEFFEKAYEEEELNNDDENINPAVLVYLLGELNYRLDNYEQTVRWFNIAISKYSKDPDVKKHMTDMIRDRWLEIKDKVIK